ncbi:Uncharacterised protein [Candidatus Burarchaeum australiense]|nr:Uncharacterised protein [Candidatus Burarchaeum australiense]
MMHGMGFGGNECDDDDCCGAGSCGMGSAGGRRIYVRMQGFEGLGVDYREMLLNWAKAELLKEKVKAKLDKKYGKELDALADALVEVMGEEGEQKKELGKKKEDARKRLKSFIEDGEVI